MHGYCCNARGPLNAVVLAVCGLACAACVEPQPDNHIGTAAFTQGSSALDSDYDGQSQAGAMALPPASSGSTMAAPPTAGSSVPPSAGGPPIGTTPATTPMAGVNGAGNGGMAGGTMMSAGGGGAGSGGASAGNAGNAGSAGSTAGGSTAAGAGGSAGEGTSAGASAGTLKITFTTVNQSGRYAPANVGAVWIETGAGKFVKTIKRWAGIRAGHLTKWAAVSGGWPSLFRAGNAADQMDAISAATLRTHGMQDLSWDMKDLMGAVVPDGPYKVGIEVTEDNRVPGANVAIEFTKGPMPHMVKPADAKPYSGLTISYQP